MYLGCLHPVNIGEINQLTITFVTITEMMLILEGSDQIRPHTKWWFSKGNPLISGKSRLLKYYNLAISSLQRGVFFWLIDPWFLSLRNPMEAFGGVSRGFFLPKNGR